MLISSDALCVFFFTFQLMQTLEEDEFSRKNKLAWKLEQVHAIMSGESEA